MTKWFCNEKKKKFLAIVYGHKMKFIWASWLILLWKEEQLVPLFGTRQRVLTWRSVFTSMVLLYFTWSHTHMLRLYIWFVSGSFYTKCFLQYVFSRILTLDLLYGVLKSTWIKTKLSFVYLNIGIVLYSTRNSSFFVFKLRAEFCITSEVKIHACCPWFT